MKPLKTNEGQCEKYYVTPEENNGNILTNTIELKTNMEDKQYIFYLSCVQNKNSIILINKPEDELTFQYELQLSLTNLQKINQYFKTYSTIEQAYYFFYERFNSNKVFIKNIYPGQSLNIFIEIIDSLGNSKRISFTLRSIKLSDNVIIQNLCKAFKKLEEENKSLKNEISNLKKELLIFRNENKEIKRDKIQNDSNRGNGGLVTVEPPGKEIFFDSNPKSLTYIKNLTEDSCCPKYNDNFTIFKSVHNKYLLIYANKQRDLVCYDIEYGDSKKIQEAHSEYITCIRHYINPKSPMDIILSISSYDGNVKLWDAETWNCLFDKKEIYKMGELYSASLLFISNDFFLITSSDRETEPIKVFGRDKKIIKEFNDSKDNTYFLEIFNDESKLKNYIISCNYKYIKSFDYEKGDIYQKYRDDSNRKCTHKCALVLPGDNETKLIGSNDKGIINIWNFHNGEMINKINDCEGSSMNELCLWNKQFLFAGADDTSIKLFDLKNGKLVSCLKGNESEIISIKKIKHIKLGECLITQGKNGVHDTKIILWGFKI